MTFHPHSYRDPDPDRDRAEMLQEYLSGLPKFREVTSYPGLHSRRSSPASCSADRSPACPDGRKDCRFSYEGMTTLIHSPIQYDREGNPVGGGVNRVDKVAKCSVCRRVWISRQSELEDTQGKVREWNDSPSNDQGEGRGPEQ